MVWCLYLQGCHIELTQARIMFLTIPGTEMNRRLALETVFFFSSRRRHTRSLCDWSSDVCSSDLFGVARGARRPKTRVSGWKCHPTVLRGHQASRVGWLSVRA